MASPSTVLARIPLFAGLTAEELEGLEACLRRRPYRKGEVIFVQGDPGTSLYFIETGRVKIVLTSPEDKQVVLARLGPADFFGDLALPDGQPRSADAVAQEPSQLLLLRCETSSSLSRRAPRSQPGCSRS